MTDDDDRGAAALPCPACHHPDHDPGACPDCPRCELHVDEVLIWVARVSRDDYDEFIESIEADAIKSHLGQVNDEMKSVREDEAAIDRALFQAQVTGDEAAWRRLGKLLPVACVFPTGLGELPYYCATHGHIRDALTDERCRVALAASGAERPIDEDRGAKALTARIRAQLRDAGPGGMDWDPDGKAVGIAAAILADGSRFIPATDAEEDAAYNAIPATVGTEEEK